MINILLILFSNKFFCSTEKENLNEYLCNFIWKKKRMPYVDIIFYNLLYLMYFENLFDKRYKRKGKRLIQLVSFLTTLSSRKIVLFSKFVYNSKYSLSPFSMISLFLEELIARVIYDVKNEVTLKNVKNWVVLHINLYHKYTLSLYASLFMLLKFLMYHVFCIPG